MPIAHHFHKPVNTCRCPALLAESRTLAANLDPNPAQGKLFLYGQAYQAMNDASCFASVRLSTEDANATAAALLWELGEEKCVWFAAGCLEDFPTPTSGLYKFAGAMPAAKQCWGLQCLFAGEVRCGENIRTTKFAQLEFKAALVIVDIAHI